MCSRISAALIGSTHGTFVNQVRVQRHELNHEDSIRLGGAHGYGLTFRSTDDLGSIIETTERQTLEATPENIRNLSALLEISKALNSSLRLDDVLEMVMDAVMTLTRAERGMLLLGDLEDDLEVAVRRNFDDGGEQYSHSVVAEAFNSRQAKILTDAAEDARFSAQQSIVGLQLRTVMSVPLLSTRVSTLESRAGPDSEPEDSAASVASDPGTTTILHDRASCCRGDLCRPPLADPPFHRPGSLAVRIVGRPRDHSHRQRPSLRGSTRKTTYRRRARGRAPHPAEPAAIAVSGCAVGGDPRPECLFARRRR